MISTSEKIDIVLKRKNITKKKLAELMGISQPSLSQKFKRNDWREKDLRTICELLQIQYEIVFKIDDEKI